MTHSVHFYFINNMLMCTSLLLYWSLHILWTLACLGSFRIVLFNSWNYCSARSYASAEYWKHFRAHFDGVYSFGYNSAESEPIWMKSGALWVRCRRLALADFCARSAQ